MEHHHSLFRYSRTRKMAGFLHVHQYSQIIAAYKRKMGYSNWRYMPKQYMETYMDCLKA
jgi:hypothetical protein